MVNESRILKMKTKTLFILSTIILLMLCCKREFFTFDVNCSNCDPIRPDSADLIVKISIDEENQAVPLIFYKGKVEEGIIEWIDTSYTDIFYLYSRVDEYYSVKAKYKKR